MATKSELVQCVARQLALPSETVSVVDRLLAESGLRRMAGRGRGAAHMNEADAAALLIGACVPGPLKSVCERVRAFLELPFKGSEVRDAGQKIPFPSVSNSPDDHTFGEALTAVLRAATRGEIKAYLAAEADRREDKRIPNLWGLEVEFFTPGQTAFIRFFDRNLSVRNRYDQIPNDMDRDQLNAWAKEVNSDPSHGDLSVACRFTSRTIFAIAELIKGKA
ncbi:MAG: hypothetical protein WCO04_07495 [Pseudomonadota bacterium]